MENVNDQKQNELTAQSKLSPSNPIAAELEEAKDKLEKREKAHENMVAANKIIRKGGDNVVTGLKELGFSEKAISDLISPKNSREKGFPKWALSNNNADVRRLRTRVAVLEAKIGRAEQGNRQENINGVELVQNFDNDRVQLKYDSKPAENVIVELKRRGFHWSPTENAWQRKLTDDGLAEARNIAQKGMGR